MGWGDHGPQGTGREGQTGEDQNERNGIQNVCIGPTVLYSVSINDLWYCVGSSSFPGSAYYIVLTFNLTCMCEVKGQYYIICYEGSVGTKLVIHMQRFKWPGSAGM